MEVAPALPTAPLNATFFTDGSRGASPVGKPWYTAVSTSQGAFLGPFTMPDVQNGHGKELQVAYLAGVW